MIKKLVATAAFACAAFALPATGHAAESENVIIKYTADDAIFKQLSKEDNVYLNEEQQFISLPKQKLADTAIQQAIKRGSVTYIEADYKRQASNLQEHLKMWDAVDLGLPKFTSSLRPKKETVVAVVDTGVDYAHPALKDYVLEGYDFVQDDADPMDEQGHGTHVAGITLRGANYQGIKILPVRVLDEQGSGTDSHIASGIYYAVDNGATVINMSLGGQGLSQTQRDAVLYALERNVSVVVAAGNESEEIYNKYPASERDVLTIGASAKKKALTDFSNFGVEMDLVAPGQNIYSTMPRNLDRMDGKRDGYTAMDGTSMASPFVAGIVGLIRSSYPELSYEEVELLLKSQAKRPANNDFDVNAGFGHVQLQNFTTDKQVFLLNTTYLNEGADAIQVGSYGYSEGTIEVIAGGKSLGSQEITKNGMLEFALETPKQQEIAVTAILKDKAGNVLDKATRTTPIRTKDVVLNVKNEKNENAEITVATLYGVKDDELEQLSMFIETNTKTGDIAFSTATYDEYDALYISAVADNAMYARKVNAQETVTLNAEQLNKISMKNTLFNYPKEKRFEKLYEVMPPIHVPTAVIDGHAMSSLLPINFLENPTVYVDSGNYDFSFIDMGKYHAFLTMSDVDTAKTKTIDFRNTGILTRIHVDTSQYMSHPLLQLHFEPVKVGHQPLKIGVPVDAIQPTYITRGTYDMYLHSYFMGMPVMSDAVKNVRVVNNRTLYFISGEQTTHEFGR